VQFSVASLGLTPSCARWRPDFSELSIPLFEAPQNIADRAFISLLSLKCLSRYASWSCLIYFGISSAHLRSGGPFQQKAIPHRAMAYILGPQGERGIKDNTEEVCRARPHMAPPYQHLERD